MQVMLAFLGSKPVSIFKEMNTQIFKWVDNLKFDIIKEKVTASVTIPIKYHNFCLPSINFQIPHCTTKLDVM